MDKNNLPKGLSHLFKNSQNIDKIMKLSESTRESGMRRTLFLDDLIPNPYQPRVSFDKDALIQLSNSIKLHGLIQPITVRRIEDTNKYEIIAGERRVRASKLAGIEQIDVIVQSWDDKTTRQMTLLENIQREDLNHIEIARSYKNLQNELKLTQEELSKIVSKKRSTIANFLRLLDLPDKTKLLVENGEISGSYARTLLSLKNPEIINEWANDKIKKELSVNELEKEISKFKQGTTKNKKTIQKKDTLFILEQELSTIVKKKVSIKENNQKGKIEIEYSSLREKEEILKQLFQYEKKI